MEYKNSFHPTARISKLYKTQNNIFPCIFVIIEQVKLCHLQNAVMLIGKGERIISNELYMFLWDIKVAF